MTTTMLGSRYGALRAKGLTFLTQNILLVIVAKQLIRCVIRPQNFSPEGFYFVHVIRCRVWQLMLRHNTLDCGHFHLSSISM